MNALLELSRPAPRPAFAPAAPGSWSQEPAALQEACRTLSPRYSEAWSETQRVGLLTRDCLDRGRNGGGRAVPRVALPPPAAAAFDSMSRALEGGRWDAARRLVVVSPERPSDVLCALWLACRSGLFRPGSRTADSAGKSSRLGIVPLFASEASLAAAPATMAALYGNGAFKLHLAARGNRQHVVVGLREACVEQRLTRQAHAWGVCLRLSSAAGVA